MKENKNKVIQDDGMAITIVDEGTATVEPVALQSDLFHALENIRVLTNEITDLGKSINNHSVNLKEINEQIDTLSLNDRSLRDDLSDLEDNFTNLEDEISCIEDALRYQNHLLKDIRCTIICVCITLFITAVSLFIHVMLSSNIINNDNEMTRIELLNEE